MSSKHGLSTIVIALSFAAPLAAQEASAPEMSAETKAMMEAFQKAGTPGEPHRQLASMAGSYDLTVKSWHTPGAEPMVDTGTATRRMMLGDRVMVEDVTSQMMGQAYSGQGLHGYDNVTGKYWATWADSMSTGLMVSEGSCDAAMACQYTGKYHDPVSKQAQTTRMTTRWTDKDTEVFEMYGPGHDGKEAKMMEITYKKRGP